MVDSEVEFVLAVGESESVSGPGERVVEFLREDKVRIFACRLVEVPAQDGVSFPVGEHIFVDSVDLQSSGLFSYHEFPDHVLRPLLPLTDRHVLSRDFPVLVEFLLRELV